MSAFPNETAFIRGLLNIISPIPVSYTDDYQPPLDQYSRKIAVFPVEIPPPAPPKTASIASPPDVDTIDITFKSSKPPISFPLTVSMTDTIATIKHQLASQPRAPSADIQRLLLKGKALADGKLLKEYSIADGATVNLMIKPGAHWDATVPVSTSTDLPSGAAVRPTASPIPSLTISPLPGANGSPSPRAAPLPLELDTTFPPVPESAPEASSFHTVISSPGFWDRMHLFLRTEFASREDAAEAFEQFLVASKGFLTVGEIAMIRDQVGVVGMAGT